MLGGDKSAGSISIFRGRTLIWYPPPAAEGALPSARQHLEGNPTRPGHNLWGDCPADRTDRGRTAAAKGSCPARAVVGGAVAHNPISLIIPCHRVVGSSPSLTGYAGGMEKKKFICSHWKR